MGIKEKFISGWRKATRLDFDDEDRDNLAAAHKRVVANDEELKKENDNLKEENQKLQNHVDSMKSYWSKRSVELDDEIKGLKNTILDLEDTGVIKQKNDKIYKLENEIKTLKAIRKENNNYDAPMTGINI